MQNLSLNMFLLFVYGIAFVVAALFIRQRVRVDPELADLFSVLLAVVYISAALIIFFPALLLQVLIGMSITFAIAATLAILRARRRHRRAGTLGSEVHGLQASREERLIASFDTIQVVLLAVVLLAGTLLLLSLPFDPSLRTFNIAGTLGWLFLGLFSLYTGLKSRSSVQQAEGKGLWPPKNALWTGILILLTGLMYIIFNLPSIR